MLYVLINIVDNIIKHILYTWKSPCIDTIIANNKIRGLILFAKSRVFDSITCFIGSCFSVSNNYQHTCFGLIYQQYNTNLMLTRRLQQSFVQKILPLRRFNSHHKSRFGIRNIKIYHGASLNRRTIKSQFIFGESIIL
jgi:hypothetical protein